MNTFQFKISLRFFGKSFDPYDLSVRLGLEPHRVQKMGERRVTPKGAVLQGVYDESYCTFRIKRHDDEGLHATLWRALDYLEMHRSLFHRIRMDGDRIEFFVGWFSEGNTGDTLSYALMERLGGFKIDLALDVYGSENLISDDAQPAVA